MNLSRPLLQPPSILAQKLQNMCHEQGASVEFCVTSIHAKRRGREREREIREKEEQGRLGHVKSQVGGIRRYRHTNRQSQGEGQAGRPNPWSASKVQVSSLAAAELYSLLEAFSWTNVAAGYIQLGGEASHLLQAVLVVYIYTQGGYVQFHSEGGSL